MTVCNVIEIKDLRIQLSWGHYIVFRASWSVTTDAYKQQRRQKKPHNSRVSFALCWLCRFHSVGEVSVSVKCVRVLQHEVLLPAWLVSPHRDGRTLDILHLQSHVGVEFVWKKKKRRKTCALHSGLLSAASDLLRLFFTSNSESGFNPVSQDLLHFTAVWQHKSSTMLWL